MKLIVSLKRLLFIFITVTLIACEKNYTVFIGDDDAEGLSVFSDRANNVMSCYINGKSFRTRDRIERFGFYRNLNAEVMLYVDSSNTDSDTLIIIWRNDVLSPNPNSVSLILPVKKNFSYPDFGSLNGTRLALNGANGYFAVNGDRSEKGTGNIYFHRASLIPNDTTGTNSQLSGVFEASLPSYNISRGRFDHSLPTGVVSF